MLYSTPTANPALLRQLAELDVLYGDIGLAVRWPSPWVGRLRREARMSAASSSTAIEGYDVAVSDALSFSSRDREQAVGDTAKAAVECYAHAMAHVAVMAEDPSFQWLDRVLLDLHFDACSFDPEARPGRWREGPMLVTAPSGHTAYTAPEANEVVALMKQVVTWLDQGDVAAHVVVRAAMAHLHMVSVHPFEDGNGRIARIVQSLVLALAQRFAPEFGSIEDYLADHTSDYYATLGAVQGGAYLPERDATPWVEFCVEAHLVQARRRLRRIEEAGRRWSALEKLVAERDWPERFAIALEQSLFGGTDRSKYTTEADIADPTANGDFRRLLDAGLVHRKGRGRNIKYLATDHLKKLASDD